MNFNIIRTPINEVIIFKPEQFDDSRGYLFESYKKDFYKKYLSSTDFVQENESKSSFGVLRGLHFQVKPYEQAKLVRVIKGEIQDIAIDIREKSQTYLQYVSVILNDINKKQLYIPKGFAHGFLVLSSYAIVNYKMDSYFNLETYTGIKYDDPKIGIKWELDSDLIKLSKKDNNLSYL